jgi:FMN-dependent NADH-azoreductase
VHPGDEIISRDLAACPVPFITEPWIVGSFAPEEFQTPESRAAIAANDAIVDEFLSADRYVFGVPVYNLNVPATFKAYIDQIVRAGRTFGIGPEGYFPMVHGKKAIFVTASGSAFGPGTPLESFNLQEPYLRAIFGFIGITDVQFIVADSLRFGGQVTEDALKKASATAKALAQSW